MSIPDKTNKSTDKKKNCVYGLQKYGFIRSFPNYKPYDLTSTNSFMFFTFWRKGSVVAILAIAMLSGCGPAHYAYFQPQRNAISHSRASPISDKITEEADTLVPQIATISSGESTLDSPVTTAASATSFTTPTARAKFTVDATHHRNPDSYHTRRSRGWFRSLPLGHVAPRTHMIDRNSAGRKTYALALVALGVAALSLGSLFVVSSGTLMWVLSLTLPLTATLLGTASLTTIKRNQDRYRGKGWAMAAIMLGTGVLGLALVALAVISTSELISR